MKTQPSAILASVIALSFGVSEAQNSIPPTSRIVVCDETSGCGHQYIDGQKYKIISTDQVVISVSLSSNGKFGRATLSILNKGTAPIDVLPEKFTVSEATPKERNLAYVPSEKVVKGDARRAGWANAINSFGAGMATQQVTTQTNTNGTVNATGSDGSYANGTYNGTSTSISSVPDYAAQARARENIRRRREVLAAERQTMDQTTLKANSVQQNQTVSGFVYFEWDKKASDVKLLMPIGDVIYEIPFTMLKR